MNRLLIIIVFLLLPVIAVAQGPAVAVRTVTTLPSTCRATTTYTEIVFKKAADATRGYYNCNVTQNGWDGPYTSLSAISGVSGQVAFFNGVNSLTGDTDLTFATDTLTATKIAGALNGTVGATTPAAGTFTTLNVNTNTFKNAKIVEGAETTLGIPTGTTNIGAYLAFSRTADGLFLNGIGLVNAVDTGISARSNHHFYTNGTEKVTLLENGSLGIGDTTPAALLTVGSGDLFQVSTTGNVLAPTYSTATNCTDSAGAAACGAAAAGSVVIDATATSVVVSTTAVTADSQIFVTNDSSLGTRLSVTCNTQSALILGTPRVTARTAATSFTITIEVGPTTNPMCLSYFIVN